MTTTTMEPRVSRMERVLEGIQQDVSHIQREVAAMAQHLAGTDARVDDLAGLFRDIHTDLTGIRTSIHSLDRALMTHAAEEQRDRNHILWAAVLAAIGGLLAGVPWVLDKLTA